MGHSRVGKLTPRYSLLLNASSNVRLSKCPRCNRPTHLRKFALFIHVAGWGPLVLGKTCRYCKPCELIMAHRDELEAELARSPAFHALHTADSGYLVMGTVEQGVWRKGLEGHGRQLDDILAHTADFKKQFALHVETGGWRRAREE